jgi:hypothetical protein
MCQLHAIHRPLYVNIVSDPNTKMFTTGQFEATSQKIPKSPNQPETGR